VLLYTEDITDRKRVEEALRHLATHDHLTGLLNRAAFLERLERCCHRASQNRSYGFSLLFLDLDDFKEINDRHGHAAGDELLQQIAERLRRELRPKDALARFAGDEFVLLLEDTGEADAALKVAKRVQRVLGQPFRVLGRRLSIRGSLGIALSRAGVAPLDLLQQADAAMYAAKEQGEGGWVLARPD
jgi:diguanylate cyclase (GGDEF)-like protein